MALCRFVPTLWRSPYPLRCQVRRFPRYETGNDQREQSPPACLSIRRGVQVHPLACEPVKFVSTAP